jgi:two-component system, sensor histidine kinase ChiS
MNRSRFLSVFFIFIFNYFLSAQLNVDSLFSKINLLSGVQKAKAYNVAANFYKLNKPDTAIILARLSLQFNPEKNVDQSVSYSTVGESYSYIGSFDSSTIYYLKAIRIAEEFKAEKKLSSYYNGLGIVFYQLGDIEKAIQYMQKASNIKLKSGDLLYYSIINSNVAGALQRLGKFDEAVAILRTSETQLKNFNNVELLANLYNSLGSAYQLQSKNIDSAVYYYKKNIQLITNPTQDAFRLAAYVNLGNIYTDQNKLILAEENLFKALHIINKLNRGVEKITLYENLSNLYEKKKDLPNALKYTNMRFALRDSLFNIDKQKVLQDLDTKYQTEKKDLQIKQQELLIERETNKRNKLIIVFIAAISLFSVIIIYFLFKRQTNAAVERAKQKFFSNVVHEIRTPLTMIQAPLNILKQSKNSDDDIYNITLAEKNIGRLNELVNQMLDISKIETSKYILKDALGNIQLFFEDAIKNYFVLSAEKSISFVPQTFFETKLLFFDKDALEKITGNLISNAIKYTSAGKQIGLTVNVTDDENSAKLEIIVWDRGNGISKSDQEKIFNRFYRTSTAESSQKGAGIGLSLVKDLIDLYKGTVTLASRENEGSTFTVSLPLKKQVHFVMASLESSISALPNQILLVEDDTDILDFNTRLLQKNNYTVLTASNGVEALQILEKTLPDLILSDLMMPQMDGLSFLTRLKSDKNTDHIPVIFLSAKAAANSRLEVLNAGAQGFITKPFLPDELIALVKNQLSIISKKQTEFVETIKKPEKTLEEKFAGTEPYTQKFFKIIFSKFESPELTVENLADDMATNRSHFQRKIKSITGFSPSELIKIIRLEKAKEFLVSKKGNVTEVAYMSGFSSQSYFTKCFGEYFKISPSDMLHSRT